MASFQKNYDDDHMAKNRGKKSLTPVDTDKKRGPPKRNLELDELLRKRLFSLYKSVHDYAVSGRISKSRVVHFAENT